MPYPGLSMWDGSSKTHYFVDLWESFCRRLWRPWILLLTKSKGHKSNVPCQWTYKYLFHSLKFNFKWPSMAFISHISSSKTMYQRIAPGSFRTSSLLRQDIAFSPTHSNPLGGFSSGAAASAAMASAARRRASAPPSLQVIAARERRDQQYHLYPFLSFYLLLFRDARIWENLVVTAVIGGHNLPGLGWNRDNWTVGASIWWHPRFRHPWYFDDSWVLPGSNRLCREKSSLLLLKVHIFWESH